jgi:hypothetical protein
MQCLFAGQRGPEVHLAGHVSEAGVCGDRVAVHVEPEDLGASRVGSEQSQEEPDGDRLSRTVRSEVPERLADGDIQVERIERVDIAEVLGQTFDADRG